MASANTSSERAASARRRRPHGRQQADNEARANRQEQRIRQVRDRYPMRQILDVGQDLGDQGEREPDGKPASWHTVRRGGVADAGPGEEHGDRVGQRPVRVIEQVPGVRIGEALPRDEQRNHPRGRQQRQVDGAMFQGR